MNFYNFSPGAERNRVLIFVLHAFYAVGRLPLSWKISYACHKHNEVPVTDQHPNHKTATVCFQEVVLIWLL